MRYLNGKEVADYLKERQAKQVRSLKQAKGITPKMAIVIEIPESGLNNKFALLKQRYGRDIGVETEIIRLKLDEIPPAIKRLNRDVAVHGIVVQLPLSKADRTGDLLDSIRPQKDIDGLGKQAVYDSASATSIIWLINAYNIDLSGKKVALVGHGRLVGRPLAAMLKEQDIDLLVVDKDRNNFNQVREADIIISATGSPGLIKSEQIKRGAVVIDAGTGYDKDVIKGDVDDEVYRRDDLTITPKIGGVGPLTVAVLFDHLIRAASASVDRKDKR